MNARFVFVAFLCLAGAVIVHAAEAGKRIPVHVIGFVMDEEAGVVTPTDWRRGEWPELKSDTEEHLAEAVAEPEGVRLDTSFGKIAVRAYDKKHRVIHRAVVHLLLWMNPRVPAGGPRVEPQRVKSPGFTVVVPAATKLFKLQGWMPATTSTFDVDQIAARFSRACDEKGHL